MIALIRTGKTIQALAVDLGVNVSTVSRVVGGKLPASPRFRQKALECYSVPLDAWDEAASTGSSQSSRRGAEASPGSKAPGTTRPVSAEQVKAQARRLRTMVESLLDGLDSSSAPLERAKVMASAASTLQTLRKLTGNDVGEVSEARILRAPAFKRVVEALIETLKPWPDALNAVSKCMKELESE